MMEHARRCVTGHFCAHVDLETARAAGLESDATRDVIAFVAPHNPAGTGIRFLLRTAACPRPAGSTRQIPRTRDWATARVLVRDLLRSRRCSLRASIPTS